MMDGMARSDRLETDVYVRARSLRAVRPGGAAHSMHMCCAYRDVLPWPALAVGACTCAYLRAARLRLGCYDQPLG